MTNVIPLPTKRVVEDVQERYFNLCQRRAANPKLGEDKAFMAGLEEAENAWQATFKRWVASA